MKQEKAVNIKKRGEKRKKKREGRKGNEKKREKKEKERNKVVIQGKKSVLKNPGHL